MTASGLRARSIGWQEPTLKRRSARVCTAFPLQRKESFALGPRTSTPGHKGADQSPDNSICARPVSLIDTGEEPATGPCSLLQQRSVHWLRCELTQSAIKEPQGDAFWGSASLPRLAVDLARPAAAQSHLHRDAAAQHFARAAHKCHRHRCGRNSRSTTYRWQPL
jgi:hypothetical protein